MSGTTDESTGLAAFGASVPDPVEETEEASEESETDDTTEGAEIDDFDESPAQESTGYERLNREYVRRGYRIGRTAAALDREPTTVVSELAENGDIRIERLHDEWLSHLFEECGRNTDAVAEAARESRLVVSVQLVKSGVADPQEIPADCLREVHDEYHGEYYRIRDELKADARDVLWALVDIGLVKPYADFFVARLWPEDFGLSPLNCEDCTDGTAIGSYPCPECGHDPGNGYDDRGGEAEDQ